MSRSLTVHAGLRAAVATALLLCPGAVGRAEAARPASRSVPTVRVSVVRTSESDARHVVLLVRVAGADMQLGSYQGHIAFDPTALAVDSAIAGSDGSRFVNAIESARGTIRFAGFTPTGFTSTNAVRVVGRALKPLQTAHLVATVTVAGDVEGRAVPSNALIAATIIEER